MAAKDSKGNSTSKARVSTPRFNQVVFISYPLTTEQKLEIKSVTWDVEDVDNALIHFNEADYKVTLSFDDYSSSYAAFITPKGEKHSNAGYILTGRGSSPHKALKQAYYIHSSVFGGDWSSWTVQRRGEEIDD